MLQSSTITPDCRTTHTIILFNFNWSICLSPRGALFNREEHECRNYLSPNRRDFYKILFVTAGAGVFTLGLNTYYIDRPSIAFIHPNDIISWKKISNDAPGGY